MNKDFEIEGEEKIEQHPTAEELTKFTQRVLDTHEQKKVSRHLKTCTECQEISRDLSAWEALEPPDETFNLDAENLRESLGQLRSKIFTEDLLSQQEGRRMPTKIGDRAAKHKPIEQVHHHPASILTKDYRQSSWLQWGSLAAALVATLWAGRSQMEIGHLRQQLSQQEQQLTSMESRQQLPLGNVTIKALLTTDDTLRSMENSGLDLSNGMVVVLEPPIPFAEDSYEVEISREEDVIRVITSLNPSSGVLTFFLPPSSLPAGNYILRVFNKSEELPPFNFHLPISNR